MKYKSHRNTLVIVCHECSRDVTIEKKVYEDNAAFCKTCADELGIEDPEETTDY